MIKSSSEHTDTDFILNGMAHRTKSSKSLAKQEHNQKHEYGKIYIEYFFFLLHIIVVTAGVTVTVPAFIQSNCFTLWK